LSVAPHHEDQASFPRQSVRDLWQSGNEADFSPSTSVSPVIVIPRMLRIYSVINLRRYRL